MAGVDEGIHRHSLPTVLIDLICSLAVPTKEQEQMDCPFKVRPHLLAKAWLIRRICVMFGSATSSVALSDAASCLTKGMAFLADMGWRTARPGREMRPAPSNPLEAVVIVLAAIDVLVQLEKAMESRSTANGMAMDSQCNSNGTPMAQQGAYSAELEPKQMPTHHDHEHTVVMIVMMIFIMIVLW